MVVYSHSRLQCFENCPKAYWFSYIERPETEAGQGVEAFMGSRVHDALEKLYTDLKFTKRNSLKQLVSFYEREWEKNFDDSVIVVRPGMKPGHYFALGKKCIENYFKRHSPFDSDKTIACEKLVTFSLDKAGKYKMRGYIDRLAEEEDGHYVVHDYKTSSSLPMQSYFDQDRQLALYSIAVYNDFKDCDDVNLCWHYLAFDKDMHSKRSAKQLEELKKEVISVIHGVEKAEKENAFPCKKSRLCEWCQYSELCPTCKHSVKVGKLPVREFKKDEGVKFVDKFVELNGKVKKAKVDLDMLKEDILAYAEKFGLERIVGREAALKIHKSFGYSFSGLGEEEKEDLMGILKEEKLLAKFLALDTRALGSAVVKKELEPKTLKKLKKYGEKTETKGVRVVGK
jgi:putative RecB family exonuclease